MHDLCYDAVESSKVCLSPHPLLVTYEWSRTGDGGDALACNDCEGGTADDTTTERDNATTTEKVKTNKMKNEAEQENPDCSCSVCKCDLDLAQCVKNSNQCPPQLFGFIATLKSISS